MGQHLTSKVSVALVGELDVVIDTQALKILESHRIGKTKFQDWKVLENQLKSLKVLELISLTSSCANISDFD